MVVSYRKKGEKRHEQNPNQKDPMEIKCQTMEIYYSSSLSSFWFLYDPLGKQKHYRTSSSTIDLPNVGASTKYPDIY
jgi:hypothetical protein